jgi:hypothetical protein
MVLTSAMGEHDDTLGMRIARCWLDLRKWKGNQDIMVK